MKSTIKNIVLFALCTISILILTCFFLILKNQMFKPKLLPGNGTNEEITIVLDAGHGGEDGGAIGITGIYEKDLNLSITLKIGEYLEANDVNVVYTRTEDILLYDRNTDYKNKKKALDLAARLKIATETKNCIFMSIHMNSFSKSQYSGLQVYYSKNNEKSQYIAQKIQNSIKKELQPDNNRKVAEATSRIYLLDRLECPAILIECGFISNQEECELLEKEAYQEQLSKIISEEILNCIEKIQKSY